MGNKKNIFLLLIALIGLQLYSQKINCKQIHQLRQISKNYEQHIGSYTYTDDYVHFHHFESKTLPDFAFYSCFELDTGWNVTGDTMSLYVIFTCLLDSSFTNESDGASSYKRLKGVVKRCLCSTFRCRQYDENPLQLWCYENDEGLVLGMKWEYPYGNVLFIETTYSLDIPVKKVSD